ncbi:glucose-6-phosphate dehydrogenase [Trachipleistophora hominis]|uniref:Glucose-6-phosphate dehydrogenase n=1 Tax=Trachipleistophora hominis TaxID=72359 RepID=L7JXS5_TRAHO|nr:glucose-6-phosphate dehydrogenase [Trachipleistophora hominis]
MVFTHLFNVYEHIFGNGSLKGLTFKNLHLKGQYNGYEFKGSNTETFSFSVFEHKSGYNVLFIAGKGLKAKKTTVEVLRTADNVVFDIYPNKNVVWRDEVLVNAEAVEEYVKRTHVYDDYDLVLRSLIVEKELYTVPVERIKETYRLLDEINALHTSLFFYDQGVELPEQVYNFL